MVRLVCHCLCSFGCSAVSVSHRVKVTKHNHLKRFGLSTLTARPESWWNVGRKIIHNIPGYDDMNKAWTQVELMIFMPV